MNENDQQCECVHSVHEGGRCRFLTNMHRFCGGCQSEGPVAPKPEPSELDRMREHAQRAENRCAQLASELAKEREVRAASFEVIRRLTAQLADAKRAIGALRANLADANAREGNMRGEINRLRAQLHRAYAGLTAARTNLNMMRADLEDVIDDITSK